MLSRALFCLALLVTANAECQPGDAICRDQELPSNSLLQRDKRALGKELSEDSRAGVGAETVQEARVRIAKELNSNNFTISLGGCDPIRGAGDKSCCFSRGITCTNPPNPFKATETGCPLGALCTAPLNVNPFAAPSYGYCQCQGGSPCEGGQSCGMPSFPFGQTEEKPKAVEKLAAVESSAQEQRAAETAQEARVRIAKELNSDNFTISLGGCDPIRGAGDKSCCFSRGITCTNPPNPFKAAETGCPLGALCTAPLTVNPFAAPSYGYCQCQGGSPCEGGQSCGMPSFPFGQSEEKPQEAAQEKMAAVESSAKEQRTAETAQEARVRIAKELNSDNFTISLGGCDPIRGAGDKSCCFSRGITCTNPPNPFKAAETGCPLGALCTAPLNVNPFAPSYGYCQCQGGSPCDGQSCGMPSFPFGQKDEEASQKDLGAIESSAKVMEDFASKVGLETEQEARVRIAKELNSDNFTISLGQCDPVRGRGDKSCCFDRGVTCTNPPNPMKAFETGCPLGAMCTASININPFAPPAYGYCQCQGGMTCNNGQSCGIAFPNPFGESQKEAEPTAAAAAEPTALVASESHEAAKKSEEALNTSGSCLPGTSDLSCCMARGATCTNPPNPFDMFTSCPTGAVCSAGFNVNPFAGPQYGYCQCQLGAHCAADGNSCGGAGVGNPFLKCSGGLQDPPTCCPKRYTCTNPPMLNNFSATSCGLGQACDADPTLLGGHPTFGTCKCIAGTCGTDGQCGHFH